MAMTRQAPIPNFPAHLFPTIRTKALSDDANPGGDIFGGWLLAQMDLAGGVTAYGYVRNRVVTVGVESMSFHNPVFVGDDIMFFTDIKKVGNTSITIHISAWVVRKDRQDPLHVTEGLYTFVSVDAHHRPQKINLTSGIAA